MVFEFNAVKFSHLYSTKILVCQYFHLSEWNPWEARLAHGGRIKNICIFDQKSEFSISLLLKLLMPYLPIQFLQTRHTGQTQREIMSSHLSVWNQLRLHNILLQTIRNYKPSYYYLPCSWMECQIFFQDEIISMTWKCDLKITMLINRSWQRLKLNHSIKPSTIQER